MIRNIKSLLGHVDEKRGSKRNVLLITAVFLLLATFPSLNHAQAKKSAYDFYTHYTYNLWTGQNDPTQDHKLYVSTTQSLHDYYQQKDHSVNSDSDYPKLVTPDTVKPISEAIWSACQSESHSEEQFVDAVLMFVHQISYVVSPPKYPIETITENSGDCAHFSLLAASVMKADGLDVVLLHWADKQHMNIGVYLPEAPAYARDASGLVWSVNVGSKKYYIAECTGYCTSENVTSGWRVGECPDEFRQASATVIDLSNCETSSPAQVAASVDAELSTSSFTTASCSYQSPLQMDEQVLVQGTIAPADAGADVVIYCKEGTGSWSCLATTTMDYSGNFAYATEFDAVGTYYLLASWSGDATHEGADSNTMTLNVAPTTTDTYLTSPSSVVQYGDSVQIAGHVLPAHSCPSISLFYSLSGTSWSTLATISTDSNGNFQYQWTPDTPGTFYLKAESRGDTDYEGSTSDIGTLTVAKATSTITVTSSTSSVKTGESVTLSGLVSPATIGSVSIELYASLNGHDWNHLTDTNTNMDGQYSSCWSPNSSGTYYLKTCWSGNEYYEGAESEALTVQVTASSPTSSPKLPNNQNPTTVDTKPSVNYVSVVALASAIVTSTGICLAILARRTRRKNEKVPSLRRR